MSWRLSMLDKNPITDGETVIQALAKTLTPAQQAQAQNVGEVLP